jgi:hypothetical protein
MKNKVQLLKHPPTVFQKSGNIGGKKVIQKLFEKEDGMFTSYNSRKVFHYWKEKSTESK